MQNSTPTFTITPDLDWSDYENVGMGDAYADIPACGGDYAKAIAACIGSMQCMRPIDKGVMCPSFRVSGDGNLSPGGRVRLLKAALKGELGAEPFNNEVLARAMDLCVSCKGCKRECDSSVDMAKIRAEYLAQRMKLSAPSLRDRTFAALPQLLRVGYLLRLAISLRNRLPLLAQLGEMGFGISAKRKLPLPQSNRFKSLMRKLQNNSGLQQGDTNTSKAAQLVLFVDTFSQHFQPEIVEKTHLVLNKLGFEVIIAQASDKPPLCCGRTYFSGGFLTQARQQAQRTLAALLPHISQGLPIVGLEPSCILMFRDEYKSLGLGEGANLLSQNSFLLEEFLAREISAERITPAFKPYQFSQPLIVHGHCHEKSVGAMRPLRKLLKAIPNIEFEVLDNSCCGGAGSFAYEAEHTHESEQMAQLALAAIINTSSPVLTNGFSCKSQIHSVTDKIQPLHLAEFLYLHLD